MYAHWYKLKAQLPLQIETKGDSIFNNSIVPLFLKL